MIAMRELLAQAFRKARNLLYEYLFFFSFIFVQLIGTILKINTQVDASVHLSIKSAIVVLLFSAIVAYPVAGLCGNFFNKICGKGNIAVVKSENKLKGVKLWLRLWIIISIMWIPYLLAFYPGVFAYDIHSQWNQWSSGTYNTHHPIAHTLLMGWIIETGQKIFGNYNKGVACYCLSQLLALSAAAAYAVYYVARLAASKKIFFAVLVYFALLPIWPVLGISTTKDIYFSIFYLIGFIFLLDCSILGMTRKRLLLTVAALTLATLFRNNAIYGVFLSCLAIAILMLCKKCPRKIGLCFISVFILTAIISELLLACLSKATGASPGSPREMMSIPCQQIARVYAQRENELTDQEKAEIFQYIPEDRIKKYRWQLADQTKGRLNVSKIAQDKRAFVDMWARLGKKYPREYVEATLCNTLPLWYVWDTSMTTVHGAYMECHVKNVTDGKVVRNSQLPQLEKILLKLYMKGQILQAPILSLLFVPALYTWIIVAAAFILAKYKQWKYLLLPIFLLGYAATLMAGPCILPRYCMNFIACVPILMVFTYSLLQKEKAINDKDCVESRKTNEGECNG